MLQAGYLEDWEYNATLSGAPQGGPLSPVLSNIYLDRLDRFVETTLIPQYTRGTLRKHNPEYARVQQAAIKARQRGDRDLARRLGQQQRNLPSRDPQDPDYRRLRYVRYADDHLLGFAGPKHEAEAIKQRLATFLRDDLKLELSEAKTLITHARTGAARFLGYEITVQHNDTKRTHGRRRANGTIALRVPKMVIKAKQAPYLTLGKPEYQPRLMNLDDDTIISTYGAEYRGIVQYYLLAGDVWRLYRLHWVMLTSMLKTLAAKHRTTVTTMAGKYKVVVNTPRGRRTCFQASVERAGRKPLVARFGGFPLQRQKAAIITDRQTAPITARRKGTELIHRLRTGRCEFCEHRADVQVHQVRKLADLTRSGQPQPAWAQLMAQRRRKTLVVCQPSHNRIHARHTTANCTA